MFERLARVILKINISDQYLIPSSHSTFRGTLRSPFDFLPGERYPSGTRVRVGQLLKSLASTALKFLTTRVNTHYILTIKVEN